MPDLCDLTTKARDGEPFTKAELVSLLRHPPASSASLAIMAEAVRLSGQLSRGRAEVHAQFALNLGPCPCHCQFCSFSRRNGVFKTETRLGVEEAVAMAKQFEKDGANAIFIMTTATYPLERFLDISREIRRKLRRSTVMVANVGDQSLKNAQRIKNAGFAGVYHALRLREGRDTALKPEARKRSIRHFQEAGLRVGTCVEPIGPEHTNEELADMILYTASINPCFSGAARRITIPGTPIARRGMISELRMAQIVAVTRLAMPHTVPGNCTHEPCALGGLAGANLFWAEAGANPRDVKAQTEEGRGNTVADCRRLFWESGWNVLKGASRFYKR